MQHQWQRQVPLGTVSVVSGACTQVVAAVAGAVVLVMVMHGWAALAAAVVNEGGGVTGSKASGAGQGEP